MRFCSFCLLPIMFFLGVNNFIAQVRDTVSLKPIEIIHYRIQTFSTGKKVLTFDSASKQLFYAQNIGDVISIHSPVFIKNYGPGSISTTSFRGSSSQQSAVFWNGFNIQNNMLGQIDLEPISSNLFNNISLELGPATGAWGSGAIGGSLHLNNQHKINSGVYAHAQYLNGNTGLNSLSSGFHYGGNKLSLLFRSSVIDNRNNFSYQNGTGEFVKMIHASYRQLNVLPEIQYYLNSKHRLLAGGWFSQAARNYPSINQRSSLQEDENKRFFISWDYINKNIKSTLKSAFFLDKLNYTDSMARIFSNSVMNNYIIENDNYFQWKENQTLNIGINHTQNIAKTNNYSRTEEIIRSSIVVGNNSKFLNNRMNLLAVGRYEYTNLPYNPISGNIGMEFTAHKNLLLKLNVARVYRLPTLNDLYWQPGGNPNLKPEFGYSGDGTVEIVWQNKEVRCLLSGSAFSKIMDNWIIWVPGGGGLPQPMNIQKVFSRGTESDIRISKKFNKWNMQWQFISSYVLSTVLANGLENDNTTGKQLIYTPRYVYNSNIKLSKNNFIFALFYQYVGYRFTSSDNGTWLNPYSHVTARVMYHKEIKTIRLGFFIHVNNLFNASYHIIANRPMPLRNYETGITIQFNKPRKQII